MLKRLLLTLLAVNVLLWSSLSPFVRTARAQTWFHQDFYSWYTKVYDTNVTPADEIYGERYTAAQVEWVIYGVWAFIVNQAFMPDIAACLFAALSGGIGSLGTCLANSLPTPLQAIYNLITSYDYQGGAQYALEKDHYSKPLISMVFENRPLSGISYVKQKFNLVSEVQAQQGFGFTRLEVIQPLWRAARDVSYFLLVLATIIMAFMIMFRVKLSPQTTISIQSAIPKIIGGIILITFSYAIAGFMIDLVYVVIGIFASLFDLAMPDVPGIVQSGIFYRLMTEGIPFVGLGVFGLMSLYIPIFFVAFMASVAAVFGVFAPIAMILQVPLVMSMIVSILVIIILIFISIKILWMLIKTTVSIYLLVMAAPFYILGGAISPTAGFTSWFKNLASHLAIYPMTGAMFILSYLFLAYGALSALAGIGPVINILNQIFNFLGFDLIISGNAWEPPLTMNSPAAAAGGNSIGIIFCFISLSVLMMIPKLADIIKGLISGRPYAYGTAIGEAIGPLATGAAIGWGFASGGPSALLERWKNAGPNAKIDPRLLRGVQRLEKGVGVVNKMIGFGRGGKK